MGIFHSGDFEEFVSGGFVHFSSGDDIRMHLDTVCEVAEQEEPSYKDFVAYLVAQEVEGRELTQQEKRLKAARFHKLTRLEDFDFAFQTSISRQTIMDLARLDFVEDKENICLCGPSGVGKTHLAVALGYEAIKARYQVRYYPFDEFVAELYASLADGSTASKLRSILRNDVIILDELGYVSMDKTAADHMFQLVSKAYEHRSLIVTTNLDFGEGVSCSAIRVPLPPFWTAFFTTPMSLC